ncbi:hypothetical protein TB1_031503 [Malus domestica]
MGKASKWFRSILGLKKPNPAHQTTTSSSSPKPPTKDKRRWSFVKSYREKHHQNDAAPLHHRVDSSTDAADPNKHAIAVAAATAAVAEAAVSAAQAAAAVVRLTSSGRCARNPAVHASGNRVGIREEELAAVKIQAAFRGCLEGRRGEILSFRDATVMSWTNDTVSCALTSPHCLGCHGGSWGCR